MNRPVYLYSPPRTTSSIITCLTITITILSLGYSAFGFWVMMIFASGFLFGFLLWLFIPTDVGFDKIKFPYWLCLLFFLLHRIEEKVFGFFSFLSRVTDVPTPEITSWNIILLVVFSVGGWLSVPYLIKRRNELGYYFAWTFFSAMGITELAHWIIFPFFSPATFSYIPGMASVIILSPAAWFGLLQLYKNRILKY